MIENLQLKSSAMNDRRIIDLYILVGAVLLAMEHIPGKRMPFFQGNNQITTTSTRNVRLPMRKKYTKFHRSIAGMRNCNVKWVSFSVSLFARLPKTFQDGFSDKRGAFSAGKSHPSQNFVYVNFPNLLLIGLQFCRYGSFFCRCNLCPFQNE